MKGCAYIRQLKENLIEVCGFRNCKDCNIEDCEQYRKQKKLVKINIKTPVSFTIRKDFVEEVNVKRSRT